ncbi:MAG: DMT family transporter [Silicimonas sp.]|nr:DMT family transporter [Silicimonas sp.]
MTLRRFETMFLFLVLALMGAGWGMTQPLSKIAVSEGYRHFGLIFWQMAIGAATLGVIQAVRRRKFRTDGPALRVYVFIALVGTILPNSASFEAIRHLPSGLISILLALVPMFAFPIALALGNERFSPVRFGGLVLGLVGVLLIVGPEGSLPDRAMILVVPLALIAPFFYGLEGNAVARWGTAGLAPIDVLFGASVVGTVMSLPLALGTGQFIDPRPPWGAPELALVAASLIHVAVYTCYVWLVGRAGPVFAVQVSYLVTGFGVLWAILILGEGYSGWVWTAMAVMLAGMFLVQPKPREALAASAESVTMEN